MSIWNRKDHFYQNSIKVVSSNLPEPGVDSADNTTSEKINANGLYKLIWLIRDEFSRLWNRINRAWKLNDEEYTIEPGADLNDLVKVGNYAWPNRADEEEPINKPHSNNKSFTLKVSYVGNGSGNKIWQDVILLSGHRWYRWGEYDSTAQKWNFGPWMMILSHEQEIGVPYQANPSDGTADDIFLRKRDDATTGPLSFGDPSKTKAQEIASDRDIKILLSKAIYGTDEPDVYFGSNYNPELGQVYLQLEED